MTLLRDGGRASFVPLLPRIVGGEFNEVNHREIYNDRHTAEPETLSCRETSIDGSIEVTVRDYSG